MAAIDVIKNRVRERYLSNPDIHIDVSIKRPKIRIVNQEAKIIGVYKNLFQIKAEGKRYTVLYSDILIKNVRIAEL